MKICPSCHRCYEDSESYCALESSITLTHERDGTCLVGGKYRLDYRLGRGANGAVYKCTHVELNQPRAVKLLLPDTPNSDPNRQYRLRREALTACRFDHPNVVRVYDFGTNIISGAEGDAGKTSGELYIAMEFISGRTLKAFLKANKPIPIRHALAIAVQILDGLAEVHGQGVILRDLKPENVMLSRDRRGNVQVKLVDFGTVKLRGHSDEDADADLTRGMFIGTALYASPELSKGEPLDERSDIYSMGVILYELLAGHTPFPPSDLATLLYRHAYAQAPRLDGFPALVAGLTAKALSKDRGERPQSAAEFAARLRNALAIIDAAASAVPPVGAAGAAPQPVAAGEEEETRWAANAPKRSFHTPNVKGTNVGDARSKHTTGVRHEHPAKKPTKAKATNGSRGHAADKSFKGLRTPYVPLVEAGTVKADTPRPGAKDMLRTVAAAALIIASLVTSLFMVWRLTQGSTPAPPLTEVVVAPITPPTASFSAEVGEELVTKTDVNIRVGPSGKSQKIGLSEKGSRVRILTKHKNWREVIVLEHGREKKDPTSADQGWIDGDNLMTDDGG